MDIRLFQINPERDKNDAAQMSFRQIQAVGLDERIYDMTWAGLVDVQGNKSDEDALEDVFGRFNSVYKPEDCKNNMTISDVVEIRKPGRSDFYYADFDGFHKIDFEPQRGAQTVYQETLDVIFVEPGKKPRAGKLEGTLEAMQKYVGGLIEAVYPFEEPVAIICNEEGKLEGLPYNRVLRDDAGEIYDAIAGNFIICGCRGENFTSLERAEIKQFTEHFKKPEYFIRTGEGLVVVPYPDETKSKQR